MVNFNDSLPNKNSGIPESIRNISRLQNENIRKIQEASRRKAEYDQEVLDTLKGIEKNTASLPAIFEVLMDSREDHQEMMRLVQDLFEISQSGTVEEADSKYRKFMQRTSQIVKDAENMQKLSQWGMVAWEMVKKKLNGEW
ncbi:hypothetical protein CEY16_05355 [Halalkalibacillus sediminis]|uniref:Uncharacterized protein n=1 Tax=Halalkalibacillus sediminis TaxID=2018042 RepID=A0A2I0QXX3_9BACI|nr:hypothetical protein [Halalkalibacillus sediminis]PKR79175.1 hypothetical protein CEY16_05355 [Halalkalibacillus sediminis]